MFGIKMKPHQIASVLKGLGFDLDVMIPAGEQELIKEWHKWEAEAGSKLMAVAVMNETGSHLVISLYRDGGGGNLSLYKSFPLSEISQILKNLKNDTTEPSPQPVAGIGTGTPAERTEPGQPAQPGAGPDEYPAFR